MDRLEEVKATFKEHSILYSNEIDWLIVEVERLRKIEDAAVSLDQRVSEFADVAMPACERYFQILGDVLDANPRPEG